MFPSPPPFIPCGRFSPTRLEVRSYTDGPSVRGRLTVVQRSPGHPHLSRRW